MKRRTFLGLASLAAALGLPSLTMATEAGAIAPGGPTEGLPDPMEPLVENADHRQTIIKVVGVGGAGCYTVNHMIQGHVRGVYTYCFDTDSEMLLRSRPDFRFKVGSGPGFGAGGKPKIGRDLAIEDSGRIAMLLRGAQLVFIVAGLGGGTGTGASPVVAAVAREMGILTVAVVTMPFACEGRRMTTAERGLSELASNVDSLIVVSNEGLLDGLGDQVSMLDAFRASDDVLKIAVSGVAEILNAQGIINVAFDDVREVMGNMGRGVVGYGTASGVKRAQIAAEKALISPLCEDIELSAARSVVVNITAGCQLGMREVRDVMATIREQVSQEASLVFGTVYDGSIGDQLRVTVIAGRARGSLRKL